ncbi:pre-mRNA-splicing factor CWC22 homolog [Centruroides vittatus]|uniref:pre-mRNA-splicing factor CWC22 homolog n=1 Tax=Centruroides vittatus TaxID=120091 RepID=UPI003510BFB3
MGLLKLSERVRDPTMQEAFVGLFPRETSQNTRFAINFFTSIGLGGLTDELREHLKNVPKPSQAVPQVTKPTTDEDSSSSEEESSKSESAKNESSKEESRKKLKNKLSKPKNKKKSKHHEKSKKNKG